MSRAWDMLIHYLYFINVIFLRPYPHESYNFWNPLFFRIRVNWAWNGSGERFQKDAVLVRGFTGFVLDFLKVLRFSFPGFALWFALAAENLKNLPLALRACEKIWARLVGKSSFVWTELSLCTDVPSSLRKKSGFRFRFFPDEGGDVCTQANGTRSIHVNKYAVL